MSATAERVDVAALLGRVDLLALIGRDVPLKRAATTNGGEWCGPCHWCAGRDRFRVWPLATRPSWWCRQCGKHGDAIAYVMARRDGVGFKAAVDALRGDSGIYLAKPEHKGVGHLHRPVEPDEPPEDWRERAERVVAECETALWSDAGQRARDWLHARGIADETLREFRIGYQPVDGARHGLYLRRGVLIPGLAVDGLLRYLKVRRPAGTPKYVHVRGSRPALMGRLTGKPGLLLLEGELDLLVAWQEARDIADVATMGSASVRPTARWLAEMLPYRRLLLGYDADAAGQAGAASWSWSARAKRLRLPELPGVKDVTDLRRVGGAGAVRALAAAGSESPGAGDRGGAPALTPPGPPSSDRRGWGSQAPAPARSSTAPAPHRQDSPGPCSFCGAAAVGTAGSGYRFCGKHRARPA